jgi:hypothetical protein
MVKYWWKNMRGYDEELRHFFKFIFVDDGSPKHPLDPPEDIVRDFDLKLFRVKKDILWNEMGARNLAMKHTKGWAMLMDADFLLPPDQARVLMGLDAQQPTMYVPRARLVGTTKHYVHPPNLYIIHADTYWKCGGYAEEYAGAYGFSDVEFLRAHDIGLRATRRKLQAIWIDHYSPDKVKDAAVLWLNRDLRRNDRLFHARLSIGKQRGVLRMAVSNKHLQFPWERVI